MRPLDMACCAMSDTAGLEEHSSPKEALLSLCERVILKDRYSKSGSFRNYIQSIIIFSGVESFDGPTYRNGEDGPEDNYDDDYEDEETVKVEYASELAAYLREHKLGEVVAGPKAYNFLNHPSHEVQAFMWAPDRDALTAWFTTNYRGK